MNCLETMGTVMFSATLSTLIAAQICHVQRGLKNIGTVHYGLLVLFSDQLRTMSAHSVPRLELHQWCTTTLPCAGPIGCMRPKTSIPHVPHTHISPAHHVTYSQNRSRGRTLSQRMIYARTHTLCTRRQYRNFSNGLMSQHRHYPSGNERGRYLRDILSSEFLVVATDMMSAVAAHGWTIIPWSMRHHLRTAPCLRTMSLRKPEHHSNATISTPPNQLRHSNTRTGLPLLK